MLHFNLSNNNNQYCLIFQSPPYSASHHRWSILEFALCRTYPGLICEYLDLNKGETKYHTFLILLLFGCYILILFLSLSHRRPTTPTVHIGARTSSKTHPNSDMQVPLFE